MNNILSIDFDIIMAPSINFYNDQISQFANPVSYLIEQNPSIKNLLPADFDIYSKIHKLILEYSKNTNIPIFFISNHRSVINILETYFNNDQNHIINVDHHHDIGYCIQDWEQQEEAAQCGNWVKYGIEHNLINEYTWIYNSNSDFPPATPTSKLINHLSNIEMLSHSIPNEINGLIICASWEWIPNIYNSLYYSLMDACSIIRNETFYIDNFEKK